MQDPATNHDAEHPPTTNRLTEASRDESPSQQLGEASRETRRLGQRHTVKEAAEVLGTSVDAVRGRIRRGTLDSVKLDGVVYVLLDPTNREKQSDQSETEPGDTRQRNTDQSGLDADQSETVDLVEALQERIEHLSKIIDTRDEEIRRRDTIIMTLSQRIPELEGPSDPHGDERGGARSSADASGKGAGRDDQGEAENGSVRRERSWWRRFFGFE